MAVILAILVGALLGGLAADDGFGALFGAVLGWLVLRTIRQQRAIVALQQELTQRGAVVAPAPASAEPVATPAESIVEPEARAPEAPAAITAGVVDEASAAVGLPPQAAEPIVPAAEPPTPPRPSPLAPLRDWLFGGNTIVKAGIAILFLGLAFLAKYASEHVQVPVQLRLAAVGGAALVLLGLGWRLRSSRPGYAQVLQGGAVAVLYLTLFVAFRYYGVLAVMPVFVLMVAVAALAAALAVLQDARALAFIGALGGFATPLLVSTGSGNVAALFSYYLVLDLGIAAVAWYRTWRALNLLGFVFTFVVATAWGVLQYRPSDYAIGQGFLLAFFAVFMLILLLPARRAAEAVDPPGRADRWVNGSLLFGLPTVVFALQYGLLREHAYGAAIAALGFATFYVLLAALLRRSPRLALVFEGSLAVGTVFLTLVIPFAFDARSTAGAWALEGAGLVWLGWRQSRRLARAFGYLLLLLAGASLAHAIERFGDPARWLDALLFNGAMLVAAALAAARFVERHAPAASARGSGERVAAPLLIGWATLWWAATAWVHIVALVVPTQRLAALLFALAGYALLCTVLARRLAWGQVAVPVLALMPLLVPVLGLGMAIQDSPLEHRGAAAWAAAFAVHLLALHWAAPHWPRAGAHLAHALGALVLAGWGGWLGQSITADWGDAGSAWPWLGALLVPALLLGVLPRPATALRWPLRDQPEAYQRSAAGLLAAALLLWVLLANAASHGGAAPLPHVPLLNPLDLGIAAALLAAAFWQRSASGRGVPDALAAALLGACAFVWLNGMLLRGFFHYEGVPYHVDAWAGSLAVQTGLTLLWSATALALMWASARRAWRTPWMAGAALLALVVLKLLLVDLSGTGTVTRIVSFIGVGALMLVIGYVAPLPAGRRADAAAKDSEQAHAGA